MVVEVTLRQLLDMAIGSPEIGAVNFNYMYSLLHIMVIRIEKLLDASFDAGILDDFSLRESIKVEASQELMTGARKSYTGATHPTIQHSKEVSRKSEESVSKSSSDATTKSSEKKLPPSGKSASATSSTKKTFSKSSTGKAMKEAIEEETKTSLGRNVIMSKQSWIAIQRKMKILEDQVDTLLKAESEDILGHIQKYAPDLTTTQYIEMAQRVTQSKRMDMTEQLISQLSIMIEEANNQIAEIKEGGASDEMKSIVQRVREIEMTYVTETVWEESLVSVEKVLGIQLERPSRRKTIDSESVERAEEDHEMKQKITIITKQTQTLMEMMDSKMDKELYSDITGVSPAILDQISRIRFAAKFIEKYRMQYELQDKILNDLLQKMIDEGFDANEILVAKNQLEEEMVARLKEKDLLDDRLPSSVSRRSVSDKSTESDEDMGSNTIVKKVGDMERELREVMRKVEKMSMSGGGGHVESAAEDSGQLEEAKMKILELYESMEAINEQITQILDEGVDKNKQIQKLFDNYTNLKESKAETEEVALLREEKADKMTVESKVDHEIFETALNEFQQEMAALEDKIAYVDECHLTTFNTINESLGLKADRAEITPLKEYINSKVRMLLIKIKKLAIVGGPDDGAATRKQLLKKFHCVSCDKPVLATGQNFPTPHAPMPSMPAKQSISPFTTYEIELLRQQKRMSLSKKFLFKHSPTENARNKRLQLEALRTQTVGGLGPIKDGGHEGIVEVPENLDTRYCGGGHTLTFPFQRLGKAGAQMFEDIPVIKQEISIQGTDGHFYKGVPMPKTLTKLKDTEKEERKAAGGQDSPISCIPLPNMMAGASIETPPPLPLTKRSMTPIKRSITPCVSPQPVITVEPTPPFLHVSSSERDEETSSLPASAVRTVFAPNQPQKRGSSGNATLKRTMTMGNTCGSPLSTPRQTSSPPPPPPPTQTTSQTTLRHQIGMGAKFTTSSTSSTTRSAGLMRSGSNTGLQVRSSQATVRMGSNSLTRGSSGSASQLGRSRPGSNKGPKDTD